MPLDEFDHLASFSIVGAQIPADKVQRFLATTALLETTETILRVEEPQGPKLAATREPNLARVNYADGVRSEVSGQWQRITQELDSIPSTQLLGRLDSVWAATEKKIGEEVQEKIRQLFTTRAHSKADILKEEASRLAREQGLPAADRWLEAIKDECRRRRGDSGREVSHYADRKERQSRELEKHKEEWVQLLSSTEVEMGEVARRFLMLAGGVLLAGLLFWFLAIPATSALGLSLVVLFVLLALRTARPLFRRLWLSNRLKTAAVQLASAYRALSLCSLDEASKRQEGDYYETLRDTLGRIQEACRQRVALIEERRTELQTRRQAQQETLHDMPATIRPLLREAALDEWYERGRAQVPFSTWVQRVAAFAQEVDWAQMEQEAREAFAFMHAIQAEDELVRLYPTPEKQMEFLESLRQAALGVSDGEAFLALDFAAMQGRQPQVHLIVEIDDPQHSALAAAMQARWAGNGVGMTVERASDPTAITLFGLVYGYTLGSQRAWNEIEAAFEQVKKQEGLAIYPVLFPENGGTAR